MIGQRVLAQIEDGSLIDCGVCTDIGFVNDTTTVVTTQRYPDLESLLSKTSELMQLCQSMGLG